MKTRIFSLLCYLAIPMMLCSEIQNLNERPKMSHYSYDSNQVRYELYQTNGGQPYNWLFFPGGPGADSVILKV